MAAPHKTIKTTETTIIPARAGGLKTGFDLDSKGPLDGRRDIEKKIEARNLEEESADRIYRWGSDKSLKLKKVLGEKFDLKGSKLVEALQLIKQGKGGAEYIIGKSGKMDALNVAIRNADRDRRTEPPRIHRKKELVEVGIKEV